MKFVNKKMFVTVTVNFPQEQKIVLVREYKAAYLNTRKYAALYSCTGISVFSDYKIYDIKKQRKGSKILCCL